MKAIVSLTAAILLLPGGGAQRRPPVIDVHLHALRADAQGPPPLGMCTPIHPFPAWDQRTSYADTFLATFKKPSCADPVWSSATDAELMTETMAVAERNHVYGVLSGPADRVDAWLAHAPSRLIPAIEVGFGAAGPPSIELLRERHRTGRLMVLGEITSQYAGLAPDDPRLEPYWQLAEELDIPAALHVGTGPPGVIYLGAGQYRGRLHSALTLENVLVKHPKLRVYVMHAGFPMLDDMLTLLYAHPQVYVDTGVIVYTQTRAAFYRYLQALVDGGFGNRVMFGSDQMVWPETLERAIRVIEEAPFLSESRKRDILYNNAARFLRLSDAEIERHHR